MIVGYARTSTVDQVAGFEAQLRDLATAGCEKIFQEQVSSVAERIQLQAALEYVREGDVFVVAKLDRLAPAPEFTSKPVVVGLDFMRYDTVLRLAVSARVWGPVGPGAFTAPLSCKISSRCRSPRAV